MPRAIKVLHAIGGLNRGGVETWAVNVLDHIDRDRFQLDFLVHSTEEYAYADAVTAKGARILVCPGHTRPWIYWANFRDLYRQYGPYDIVHSHVYHFSGIVLPTARMLGVPIRIMHACPAILDLAPPSPWRTLYCGAMLRSVAVNATHLLACSETSLKSYVALCRPNTTDRRVFLMGIDLKPFEKKSERDEVRRAYGVPLQVPVVIYVARFVPHKNHDQLIRIADRLNPSDQQQVHFVLVGSHGSELPRLRERAAVRPYLTILESVADISGLLQASDLFFFPSLEEGFGLVSVEACAAGLPVVAADHPTVREASAPTHRDLMFPPNDDPAALERINRVLNDATLRVRLREDGLAWARRFAIEHSARELIAIYQQAFRTA